MVDGTKVSTKMTKSTGMEYLHGQVERNMRACGSVECNTAKEPLLIQKESKKRLSGLKAP